MIDIAYADIVFLVFLGLFFAAMFCWAFKVLPSERWQVLASVPKTKDESGCWIGRNYTFYGVFQANACAVAVVMLMVLMATIDVTPGVTLLIATLALAIGLPAAIIVSWLIERQRFRLTVGGSIFVGSLVGPWMLLCLAMALEREIPLVPTLAALSASYAIGEGIGRLACLSFGCCYGKPIEACPPFIRKLFFSRSLTFFGATKKAAYEGGYDGQQLVPIQAVTSVLLTANGLIGSMLFLQGFYLTSLLVTVTVTHGWRFLSEFLRADQRNGKVFTAYQWMALTLIPYLAAVAFWANSPTTRTLPITTALAMLWTPVVILSLEALWVIVFFLFGTSKVTQATLEFRVNPQVAGSGTVKNEPLEEDDLLRDAAQAVDDILATFAPTPSDVSDGEAVP